MIVLLFDFGRTFILIIQTDAGGNARIGAGHVAGIYVARTVVVGCNICIEGRVGGHCKSNISKNDYWYLNMNALGGHMTSVSKAHHIFRIPCAITQIIKSAIRVSNSRAFRAFNEKRTICMSIKNDKKILTISCIFIIISSAGCIIIVSPWVRRWIGYIIGWQLASLARFLRTRIWRKIIV